MSVKTYVTPTSWKIDRGHGVSADDFTRKEREARRAKLVELLTQATALASTELACEVHDNTSALELLEACSAAAALALRKRSM